MPLVNELINTLYKHGLIKTFGPRLHKKKKEQENISDTPPLSPFFFILILDHFVEFR